MTVKFIHRRLNMTNLLFAIPFWSWIKVSCCNQGCGVRRFFRIPTPSHKLFKFKKSTPTPDSQFFLNRLRLQHFRTPDSDSSSFEKTTSTPAILKKRLQQFWKKCLRLQHFWKPDSDFINFEKMTPTPAENMRLHRLHNPGCNTSNSPLPAELTWWPLGQQQCPWLRWKGWPVSATRRSCPCPAAWPAGRVSSDGTAPLETFLLSFPS